MTSELLTIPNVGPAIARGLEQLGIERVDDLRGQDAHDLFRRLCKLDGARHDPCLLDTFVAAVSYADGGPARPWWEFSRERKAREARLTTTSSSWRGRPRRSARDAARGDARPSDGR
jgi:Pathogenicity locus